MSEEQETWHWRYWTRTRSGDGSKVTMTEVYKWDRALLVEIPVAECENHDDALAIIADHTAAARLAEALSQRQAAENAARVFLQHVSDVVFAYDGTKTDDKDVLVTALWDLRAQRQAAVEEAERLARELAEARVDGEVLINLQLHVLAQRDEMAAANQDAREIVRLLRNKPHDLSEMQLNTGEAWLRGMDEIIEDVEAAWTLAARLASQPPAEAEGAS